MKNNYILLAGLLAGCLSLPAQVVKPKSVLDGQPEPLWDLTYRGTPLQNALDMYGQITGRIMIKAPNVSPITLDLISEEKLPETEVLKAIETALELNNISLVPQGANFIIVKTTDTMLQGPGVIVTQAPEEPFPEDSTIIQQVIALKYITAAELQPVIQPMLHTYGKVQGLERTNSLLIMDTMYNVQRVIEILKLLDKPALHTEEQRVIQIEFAQASEVAAKLLEIIAESVAENERSQAAAQRTSSAARTSTTPSRTTPPGIIRARTGTSAAAARTSASFDLSGDASSRGLITGKPQIIADERTNILIIISRPENFPFFEDMIKVLDTKVDPEITFKNIRLEFADAEELAAIINELIGAAVQDSRSSQSNPGATRTPGGAAQNASRGANTISDFINNQNRARTTPQAAKTATQAALGGNLGEISENTQIIADPRTNSLLIMGRTEDIKVLEKVVSELDIMLDQVLIEAVILEVSLNDNIAYGLDWLQRSLTVANTQVLGPRGGINSSTPIAAFGGGSRQGGSTFLDGADITRDTELADGALSYFASFYDLNLDLVVSLASGSSDARVLSTPVVLTTDNTEASIIVGERRPIPTSTQQGLGTGVSRTTVDYENIGIEIKVTPRINPQGFVVMEIEQSADNVGGNVVIGGDEFPIITTRQIKANMAVQNGQTIVLGGLVSEDQRDINTKVPFLGDFPILGNFFKSERAEKNRTELLVLITPYVLSSIEAASAETKRLFNATKGADHTWHRRWSDSNLNPDKAADTPMSRFRFGGRKAASGDAAANPVTRRPTSLKEASPDPVEATPEPASANPTDQIMPKSSRIEQFKEALRGANAQQQADLEWAVANAARAARIEAELTPPSKTVLPEPTIPAPVFPSPSPIPTEASTLPEIPAAALPAPKITLIPVPAIPVPVIPTAQPQAPIVPKTPPPATALPVPTAASIGQAKRVPSPPGSVPPVPRPDSSARLTLPAIGPAGASPGVPKIAPAPPPIDNRIEQHLNTNAPPPKALNQIPAKKLILDNRADK